MPSLAVTSLAQVGISMQPACNQGLRSGISTPRWAPLRVRSASERQGLVVGTMIAATFAAVVARGSVRRERRTTRMAWQSREALGAPASPARAPQVCAPARPSRRPSFAGADFDPVRIRRARRARSALGGMELPRRAMAHLRLARSVGASGMAWLTRCSVEAVQLEDNIVEDLGLDSLLESGDLPKLVANVSSDVYGDVVAGKVGLLDICSDILVSVLSELVSPF
mmetsp:Transcript_10128/g.25371  ORF Transcript_10128/g.25371 Transcript_10128/m.25371 type:complete len:225 (-) Transcript_10128:385-1059(-)